MNWFFSKRLSRLLLAIGSCLLVLLSAQPPNVATVPPRKAVSSQPVLFSGTKAQAKPPSTGVAKDTSKAQDADQAKANKPAEPLFAPLRSPEEIRGVWLTNNDMVILKDRLKLSDAIGKLAQLKFNTLYPVIWNSGYAIHHSQIVQQRGIQSFLYRGTEGQDILTDVLAQGRRNGMLVIPWFEFGFMAPLTSELALKHPDWLTQQLNGELTSIGPAGEVAWLNPFRPEVQQFITDLVVEVIANYDVDGIQFDDHMSLPYKFGYDPYTVALYKKEMKKDPPTNPQDEAWIKWRADKITEFMVRLKQAVRQRKPNAIFSVSPNYAAHAYKFQLQDWVTWVKQGIVDELIVQVYRSDFDSFKSKLVLPEMLEAQKKIPTAVGIMAGLRRRPVPMAQIQQQVFAAKQQGLGSVFFYLESLWDEGPESPNDRLSGLQYLFPRIAERPRPPQSYVQSRQ